VKAEEFNEGIGKDCAKFNGMHVRCRYWIVTSRYQRVIAYIISCNDGVSSARTSCSELDVLTWGSAVDDAAYLYKNEANSSMLVHIPFIFAAYQNAPSNSYTILTICSLTTRKYVV